MMNKTTKDYARDLADQLGNYRPFVRDNNDVFGQFCCLAKWGGVYTVGWSGDGEIIIEKSIFDGWEVIWNGKWNSETDMDKFIERIWDGDTGDKLTEKDDDDEDDEDDEEEDDEDSE